MKLNVKNRKITYGDSTIDLNLLSEVEFSILLLLIENSPSPVSRDSIKEICWAGKVVSDGSINVAINSIRTIFSHEGMEEIIITVRGVGYCINQQIEILSDNIPSDELRDNMESSAEFKNPDSHVVRTKNSINFSSLKKTFSSRLDLLSSEPHALFLIIANITLFVTLIKVILVYIEVIKL